MEVHVGEEVRHQELWVSTVDDVVVICRFSRFFFLLTTTVSPLMPIVSLNFDVML